MSVINDTLRFLVARRLWPVAILLVAAAAAVPMLLAKDPAPAPAEAPTAAVKADKDAVLAEDPIVTEAADGDRSGRRQVLGSRKDPFKPKVTPTPAPKPAKAAQPGADSGSTTSASTGSPASGSTPTTGASPAPGTTAPVVPKPPKKQYEMYELTVRFGSSSGQPGRRNVKRLQALPSNSNPVLIYLGVLADKKTAVFLLDSGVVAEGDGDCHPSRNQCETIHIRQGETEFFDLPGGTGEGTEGTSGAQYQLDVLKLHKTTTTDAKKASKARASVSKKGRMILRARVAGDGPLRYSYDAKTGRLDRLSKKAYKAVVAKAARAARAHF